MGLTPLTPFQERFQELLAATREKGQTKEQLRVGIGCSKNMIAHWEAGRHEPQPRHAGPIAKLLGISVDELFERRPSEATEPEPDNHRDLLDRLTALELDVVLEEVGKAAPHLRQFSESIPRLLDLLNEARVRVEKDGEG